MKQLLFVLTMLCGCLWISSCDKEEELDVMDNVSIFKTNTMDFNTEKFTLNCENGKLRLKHLHAGLFSLGASFKGEVKLKGNTLFVNEFATGGENVNGVGSYSFDFTISQLVEGKKYTLIIRQWSILPDDPQESLRHSFIFSKDYSETIIRENNVD